MSALTAAPPRRRAALGWSAAAAAVLAAFLVLGLLAEAFVPGPSGPAESSLATSADGAAAWAALLARAGHPVGALRTSLADRRLTPAMTLVVLGLDSLDRSDEVAVRRFLAGGGRLVLGGGDPAAVLPKLIADPPRFDPSGPTVATPLSSGGELAGVSEVVSAGQGMWAGHPAGALLGTASGDSLLVARTVGRGQVLLLADPAAVENRLLGTADNALLALRLAGAPGRPVVFDETLHGFGAATGLSAIPTRWWIALAGLGLAAAAWAYGRARRLGPPEMPAEAAAPPRAAYIEAVGATLERTRDIAALVSLARARAQIEVARRLGPRADALDPEQLGRLRVDAGEAAALRGEGSGTEELLALGGLLARLRGGRP